MEAGRQRVWGQPKLHGLYPKGKKSLKAILKIKLILVFPKIKKNGNKKISIIDTLEPQEIFSNYNFKKIKKILIVVYYRANRVN